MSVAAVEFDVVLNLKLVAMRDVLAGSDFKLCLFVNNVTLTPNTEVADLTLATSLGLTAITFDWADFGTPVITAHVAVMTAATIRTWTLLGSATTIYGYVLTNEDIDTIYFGETFATPIALATGQSLTIQPQIKDRSMMF